MNHKLLVFKKHNIVSLFILALTSFYCILPLVIHTGLPYSHDIVFHIFQAEQFNQALHNGFLYPQWILDSNNGYGSPSFVFYSPLSYYVVSIIKMLTPSITIAMIIAIWFSFFFSGITMFIAIDNIFGGARSLLPAILYQIFPFHLWDLYLRGTFAEIFAFGWFPLIIFFVFKVTSSKNNNAIIGLSFSYAGLVLTHLVSSFIFSFVLGFYLIYNYFSSSDKKSILRSLFSLIIGLGMSALYFIPVIFERKYVQIERIINCPIGNYKKNFLFIWDKTQIVLQSFYIPMHIGVVLEVMVFLSVVLLIRKNKQLLLNRPMLHFFTFLFLFALLVTTPLSRPIWDLIPGFPFLQFPWRWVSIMELSLCLLIGAILSVKDFPSIRPTYLKRVFIYLLLTSSLISFITISKSKIMPEGFINKALNPENIRKVVDPPLEYTPVWAKNIDKIMSEVNNQKISVISGFATTRIAEWKSEKRVIIIKAPTAVLLRISTFYYPGWNAEINGKRAEISVEKDSGAMLIDIPEGSHVLELKFIDTPLRYYSKLISLSSCFVIFLLSLFPIRPKIHSFFKKITHE